MSPTCNYSIELVESSSDSSLSLISSSNWDINIDLTNNFLSAKALAANGSSHFSTSKSSFLILTPPCCPDPAALYRWPLRLHNPSTIPPLFSYTDFIESIALRTSWTIRSLLGGPFGWSQIRLMPRVIVLGVASECFLLSSGGRWAVMMQWCRWLLWISLFNELSNGMNSGEFPTDRWW